LKTKFAVEKSEYARLIRELMNGGTLDLDVRLQNIARLKDLETLIKAQGDELIFIVTTRDTNPLEEGKTCAPPAVVCFECHALIDTYKEGDKVPDRAICGKCAEKRKSS